MAWQKVGNLEVCAEGELPHRCVSNQNTRDNLLPCRVLFVHTGGLLGMYDKEDQLQGLVKGSRVERLQVRGRRMCLG